MQKYQVQARTVNESMDEAIKREEKLETEIIKRAQFLMGLVILIFPDHNVMTSKYRISSNQR